MAKHENPGYRALLSAVSRLVAEHDTGQHALPALAREELGAALDIVRQEKADNAIPPNLVKLRAMLEKLPDGTLGSVQALEPPYQRDMIPYAIAAVDDSIWKLRRAAARPNVLPEE